MEYVSGNIYMRHMGRPMQKDEIILGHRHHFDHTTIVLAGKLEVSLLKDTETDIFDNPVKAEIEQQWILSSEDTTPWQLILAGKWHMLRALEDNTKYVCVYSHQYPQALSMDKPGQLPPIPNLKTDEFGDTWIRVNPNIVQVTSAWSEAYNR